jgi:uncharacterized Ntn-hydrolase superfamily protein
MALRQGSECFTRWTHVENGQVVNRRLHQIDLQTHDGRLRTITGDKLPDFIQTCAGHGYVSANLAQVLLSPKALSQKVLKQVSQLPATSGWWQSRGARSRLAALRQTIECFTRLDHVENGQVLYRRVHRIEVQTDGRLYVLTGRQLPEFIGISTGQGHKGEHRAQILMSPDSLAGRVQKHSDWLLATDAWPGLRDVVHLALGVVAFLVIRFLLNLIISVA